MTQSKFSRIATFAVVGIALVVFTPNVGRAQTAQPSPSANPAPSANPIETISIEDRHGIEYQEYRIGGRLERVTIQRKYGWTEIYQNNRKDTIWAADEDEIGEVPNMRQWTIGVW